MEQPAEERLPDPADAPAHAEAREVVDALYRVHGETVAAICRALLRDSWEAEDAMQQVFLSAHRAVLRGVVPRKPDAWLATIARRECWAHARARRAAPLPAADAGLGENVAAVERPDSDELAAVWAGIAQLPPRQRDALLLREIRGLSYDQLAERLAISPASVRSLLSRARGHVRAGVRGISTALGGTQWLDALLRLAGGSSSPAATAAKVAAVGLGGAAVATSGMTAVPAAVEPMHTHAAVHLQALPSPPPTSGTDVLRTIRRAQSIPRAAHVRRASSRPAVSHPAHATAAPAVHTPAPDTGPAVAAGPAPVAPPVADDRSRATSDHPPEPERSGPGPAQSAAVDSGGKGGSGPSESPRDELGSHSGHDGSLSVDGDATSTSSTSSTPTVTDTVAAEGPDGSESSGESSGSSSGHDDSTGSADSGRSGHGGSGESGGN